jgi:large subunit ribosomal protein L1
MGKTKTAIIDDSIPQEEEKKPRKKILGTNVEREKKLTSKDQDTTQDLETTSGEKKEKILEIKPAKKEEKKEAAKGKKIRSKRYLESKEKVDKSKAYDIEEGVTLAKDVSYSKYDGSLEIHINTSIKNLRGLVSLPFASGKKLKIVAFGKGAEDSGADLIGDDAALKEIEKGKINFDVLVTTAEWMPKLARAAKILGPKGLMPNPKNGTISTDLKKTITELQGGKVEYKSEKDKKVIHLGVGKVKQPTEELTQNIKVLLAVIGKTKIKKVVISPTLGPGIKLNTSNL